MKITHEAAIDQEPHRESLFLLKEGNKRYLKNNISSNDEYNKLRERLANGQNPFAAVLCCADSRVSPEIIFDQNLGNLFVIRNAGNVVDDSVLGSGEYAAGILNIPLLVVCGHSRCGAVIASFEKKKMQHQIDANDVEIAEKYLDKILNGISACGQNPEDVHALMIDNIQGQIKKLRENNIIRQNKTQVIGAYYDIVTGSVIWV